MNYFSNLASPRVGVRSGQNMATLCAKSIKTLSVLYLLLVVVACGPTKEVPVVVPPPIEKPVVKEVIYSAVPIKTASIKSILYAQTVLKSLGFRIGAVDGIWGPRSANAIRSFEMAYNIMTANGHLSELNLHHLEKISGLNQDAVREKPERPKGISSKLSKKVALREGPQLIIVERDYQIYAKPNPYSAKLTRLAPGMGIYVVSRQDEWYEIESINRLKGFIKAD